MADLSIDSLSLVIKSNSDSAVQSIDELIHRISNLKTVTGSTLGSLNSFASSINKISTATKGLDFSSFNNINTNSFGKYSKNADEVTKSTLKATQNFNNLYNKISSVYVKFTLLYGITKRVTGVFAECLNASTDYTETINKLQVALGNCSDEAIQFSQNVSSALGIDTAEFLDYQSTFGSMLKGFKVQEDHVQMMSQQLTQLAYDYSSLYNKPVSEAFNKLNSALSGQIKGLKEYGNNVAVARVQETALRFGITEQISKLDTATQAYLRYITIMENAEITGVFNDMARTIDTTANRIRILSSQIIQLKRSIGNIFNAIASRLIPYLNIAIGLIIKLFSFFGAKIGYDATSGLENVASSMGGISDVTEDVGDSASSAKKKVEEYKKSLQGFDELNIIPAPDSSDSGGSSGSGGTSSGGAGGFDFSGVLPQYDFLEGLNKSIDDEIAEIQKKLEMMFEPMSASWKKYGEGVISSFKYKWQEIGELINSVGKSFSTVWHNGTGEETIDHILSIITDLNISVGNLAKKFDFAWSHMGIGTSIIQNLWNSMNNILGIGERIAEDLRIASNDIDFVPLVINVEKLSQSFDILSSAVGETFYKYFKNVLLPLQEWRIEVAVPSLIGSLSRAFNGLGKILEALQPSIDIISKLYTAFYKLIGNAILKGIEIFASAIDFLGSVFKAFPILGNTAAMAIAGFIAVLKVEKILATSTAVNSLINGMSILGGLASGNLKISDLFNSLGSHSAVLQGMSTMMSALSGKILDLGANMGVLSIASDGAVTSSSALGSVMAFLASNPVVALGIGIGAVTATVLLLSEAFGNQNSKYKHSIKVSKQLAEESQKLAEAQEKLNKEMSTNVDSINGEYLTIEDTYKRLVSLGDEQIENIGGAKILVDSLNQACGEEVVQIENGRLKWLKTKEAIEENIDALKRKALVEATEEAYANALKDQDKIRANLTKAVNNQKKAESELNEELKKHGVTQDDIDSKTNKYQETLTIVTAKNKDLVENYRSANKALDEANTAYSKNQKALKAYDSALEYNSLMLGENGTSVTDLVDNYMALEGTYTTIKGKNGELVETYETMGNALVAYDDVIKGHGDNYQTMTEEEKKNAQSCKEEVIRQLAEKAVAHGDTYKKMKEKLGSAWDSMTEKEKQSLKQQYDELSKNKTKKENVTKSQNSQLLALLNKYHIDKNSKEAKQYEKELAKAQKNGTQSGSSYIENLASELEKGKKKTDSVMSKLSLSAKTVFESVTAEIQLSDTDANNKINNFNWKTVKDKFANLYVTPKLTKTQLAFNGAAGVIGSAILGFFAKGGLPNKGQLFVANESGPELVGNLGGQSMVANQMQVMDMITDSMAQGFAQAVQAMSGNDRDITINATFQMDSATVSKQVIKYHNGVVMQTGKSPLKV